MELTLKELNTRYKGLETECEIARRRRQEEAKSAVQSLSKISPAQVEKLSCICPEISIICSYTEDDIIQDKNGEIATINLVREKLHSYLESRLAYYEEQLG